MNNPRVGLRRRLEIGGVSISCQLVGAKLGFVEDGYEVTFLLPSKEVIKESKREGTEVASMARGRRCTLQNGKTYDRTTALYISVVDVFVEARARDKHLFIRNGELRNFDDFNKFLHSNTRASLSLRSVGNNLAAVGERAIERWLQVVRWRGNQRFASITGERSVRVGYQNSYQFSSLDPKRDFNYLSPNLDLSISDPIRPKAWSQIEKSLMENENPPIWLTYFVDASHRSFVDDRIGTILSCAISIESLIRSRVDRTIEKIPQGNKKIRSFLRRIQMSEILTNFNEFSELASLNTPVDMITSFQRIFTIRNDIMHGKRHNVLHVEAEDAVATTAKFIQAVV